MSRSLLVGRVALMVSLGAVAAAQAPNPVSSPVGPPALVVPASQLVPEAVLKVGQPGDLTTLGEAVWISDLAAGTLLRVDPRSNQVISSVATGGTLCRGMAADFEAILVPHCSAGAIIRIDPKTNGLTEPIATPLSASAHSIATGVGSIWAITDDAGTIVRIDPVTGAAVALTYTAKGAVSIAFGEDALWVASPAGKVVTRINPYNNLIAEAIPVSAGPGALAVGEGAVWTWNESDGSVTRIDSKTNTVATTIQLVPGGGSLGRIVAGEGSVWVATRETPLTRIDPRSNRVAQVFTGDGGGILAIANGSLWMAGAPGLLWRLGPRRIEATRPGFAARTQP